MVTNGSTSLKTRQRRTVHAGWASESTDCFADCKADAFWVGWATTSRYGGTEK